MVSVLRVPAMVTSSLLSPKMDRALASVLVRFLGCSSWMVLPTLEGICKPKMLRASGSNVSPAPQRVRLVASLFDPFLNGLLGEIRGRPEKLVVLVFQMEPNNLGRMLATPN